MKKLVYILSIAIGLVVTGCAQWEDFDSLAPDTWGPVPELTVELDAAALDAEGNLIKDYLPIRITTKHATDMGYVVSTTPAEVNYTSLLQGSYGNFISEVDSAGSVIEHDLEGATPGNTYYIYAVAANAAGVQTTAVKAVGAIDVDAPQPLTNPQLTATQGGKRAVIAFNENILRDETMGAIKYAIYNIDTNEFVEEGVVADATAAANNLTVTLPATVEYAAETYYIVVLSFEEGAVTDLYGNKMAAIEGVYNVDDMAVETGYWWLVEPKGNVDPNQFFNEGTYYIFGVFTQDGEQYQAELPVEFAHVADNVDLSEVFGTPQTATQWDINGFLTALYGEDGIRDVTFPGYSYTFTANNGMNVQDLTIIDINTGRTKVGEAQVMQGDNTYYEVFIGSQEEQGLLLYWDFFLMDENGNPEAPLETLNGYWALDGTPSIFVYGDFGQGEGFYIFFEFDGLMVTREGGVQAANVTMYEKPVKVNANVIEPTLNTEKKLLLNK